MLDAFQAYAIVELQYLERYVKKKKFCAVNVEILLNVHSGIKWEFKDGVRSQ